MNQERLKGKWNQVKGEIKKKWSGVTDDDLLHAEGNLDMLVGKIQERTGEQKEAIQKALDRMIESDRRM